MGDCYSVELRVKLRKSTKAGMQRLMRQWMRDVARPLAKENDDRRVYGVRWSLSTSRKAGIRPDSFGGICKILLAFHQGNARHVVDGEGFDLYRSGFNASYGWYAVMTEAFNRMAWALEEGSLLEIDRDWGHDIYEIGFDEDGEATVWETHRKPYEMR